MKHANRRTDEYDAARSSLFWEHPRRAKISFTPRRKVDTTHDEASRRFSLLMQTRLKIAPLKDTHDYSQINHNLLVSQLFPAAFLISYLIAILSVLQPIKWCYARRVNLVYT
jgi:hypothetical protein